MRVLVVHHARRTNDSNIYMSDNFTQANNQVYGAQELDTWAGIRLLSNLNEIWRLEICPNESVARLIDNQGHIISICHVNFLIGFRSFFDKHYLFSLIKYLDPSVAFFSRKSLIKYTRSLFKGMKFDFIWWETQFYDSLIPKESKSLVRSVNFEPTHVLAEDASPLRYVRHLAKNISEKKIARSRQIVAISPNDLRSYSRLGAKNVQLLPLRQLPLISEIEFVKEKFENDFLFFGSNFDILHNRRNLEFILNEVAPQMLAQGLSNKIYTFGHRIPSDFHLPTNVIHSGFTENLQGKQLGSIGVIVPYHGGAGMQSKVFEPLILGVPIIANPKNFAGFNFEPFIHFYPATNALEYLEGINYFVLHKDEREQMGRRAREESNKLFSRERIQEVLSRLFSHAV